MLMPMMMGLSVQSMLDLLVAGVSLMIGLGIFGFIASILCSAAFFINSKDMCLIKVLNLVQELLAYGDSFIKMEPMLLYVRIRVFEKVEDVILLPVVGMWPLFNVIVKKVQW